MVQCKEFKFENLLKVSKGNLRDTFRHGIALHLANMGNSHKALQIICPHDYSKGTPASIHLLLVILAEAEVARFFSCCLITSR